MTIKFICPSCDSKFQVEDKDGGRTGPCPKCGASVKTPKAPLEAGRPQAAEWIQSPTGTPDNTSREAVASALRQSQAVLIGGDFPAAVAVLQPLLRSQANPDQEGRAEILGALANCHASVGLLAPAAYLYRKAAESDSTSEWSRQLDEVNRRRQEAVAEASAELPPKRNLIVATGMKIGAIVVGFGVLTGIPQEVLSVSTSGSSGFYIVFLLLASAGVGVAGWYLAKRYNAAHEDGQARIKDLTEDYANPHYPTCTECGLRYKGMSLISCPHCGHAQPKPTVPLPVNLASPAVHTPVADLALPSSQSEEISTEFEFTEIEYTAGFLSFKATAEFEITGLKAEQILALCIDVLSRMGFGFALIDTIKLICHTLKGGIGLTLVDKRSEGKCLVSIRAENKRTIKKLYKEIETALNNEGYVYRLGTNAASITGSAIRSIQERDRKAKETATVVKVLIALIAFGVIGSVMTEITTSSSKPDAGLSMPSIGNQIVMFDEYDRIQNGMSYRSVVSIIGAEGEEMARNKIDGVPGVLVSVETIMYQWVNSNGSNMNAMFQNDKLMQKAQFGLR